MTAPSQRESCRPRTSARRRPPRSFALAPAARLASASGRAPLAAGALAFALCFAYAFLRYVVLKGEPLANVPLYVTNKAVALFAILLMAASARSRAPWRRTAQAAGLFAAVLHGLESAVLLRPAYLAKLHAPGGRLTGSAELAVICGVAAVVALAWLKLAAPATLSPRSVRWAARGVLALVGVHCAALGASGWLEPARWPGGLPPLTLLGALAAATGLAAALIGRRRARAPTAPTPAAGARLLHPRG